MIPAVTQFFFHTLVGRTIFGYFLFFSVPTLLPAILIILIGVKGLRHLFSYEPRPTIIHKLDPRLKVLYPFTIGVVSVFLNWNFVFLLLAFTLIPWILVRPSLQRVRVILALVLTPAIGLVWSQGLFYVTPNASAHMLFFFPPTLSWYGTPGLSSTGLLYGLQQAGRVMVATSSSLILLLTTKPSEIIWAFYKFRMPATVGLAFTAALRYLPQLIERMTVLLQVMQVRGYDLTQPRWWELHRWPDYVARVLVAIPIVTVPLLIGSLRSTSVMALVADARAFGAMPNPTSLHEHEMTLNDRIAIGTLAAVVVAAFLLVVFHIGNRLA
ncbi:MAG TPA: energy-coupling factor transporter transmembrane component T [Ktedonobacteraceae bacterium]|jgi:energy-coupling factor transport system permease protein